MNARRVGWLLAAAFVIIAFAIWVSSLRHLERATLAGDLVLPGLTGAVNTVTQVKLTKGNGTQATLQKGDGGWQVGERGWPAEVARVRKLLLDLGALNVVEEKTRLQANYPQLGVEDVSSPKATGTQIDAVTPTRTFSLIVGKSSSGKSGYVRVAGTAPSLLAAPLLTLDADPKTWLERSVIDLPVARVRQVEEKPAEGQAFTATRDKKEQADFTVAPIPKGRALTSAGAADAIAAALSSLMLEDVQKAAAPAGGKLSHAVFRTFDGLEIEAAGRKDGAHAFISLKASASAKDSEAESQQLNTRLGGWEFEIPEYKYSAIFRTLEELLQPLPPKPEAKKAKAPAPSGK